MNIVSEFIKTVTDLVQAGAAANAAKLAQAISPVFFAAIGLYVVFIAYEIIYSQREVIMSEVTKTIMAFTAVGAFTYSAPYYAQYVIPFVMHAGQDLSNAVMGTSDTASSIDSMWDNLTRNLDDFLIKSKDNLDWTDIGGYLAIYSVYAVGYVGGAILIFYATIFLCVATFMVGIVLSVGIVFICFSAFPSTRSMFTSWCGTCLNYVLLNLFYTISFSFVIKLISNQMDIGDNPSFFSVITLLLVIMISVFLIEQIGTLCSSLTGGVGINGLTAAANGVGGRLTGGLAKASGMRSFMRGMGSKMSNPAFNAGQKLGSKLNYAKSMGSKVSGG